MLFCISKDTRPDHDGDSFGRRHKSSMNFPIYHLRCFSFHHCCSLSLLQLTPPHTGRVEAAPNRTSRRSYSTCLLQLQQFFLKCHRLFCFPWSRYRCIKVTRTNSYSHAAAAGHNRTWEGTDVSTFTLRRMRARTIYSLRQSLRPRRAHQSRPRCWNALLCATPAARFLNARRQSQCTRVRSATRRHMRDRALRQRGRCV